MDQPMRFEMFRAAIIVVSCAAMTACNGPGGGDSSGSISCDNVSTMSLCLEYPNPTASQQTNVPNACSSTSGTFSSMSAACPTAGFQGKCTIPPSSGGMDGIEVKRFYNLSSSDLAYQADFCATVAHGVWSTTF